MFADDCFRIGRVYAAVVFCVALSTYGLTLAPTVTLVDSGELIVAASSLGVAHPPGFPLYVILAHLATLLPFSNVASRVNLASALFGALAAALMTLIVVELLVFALSNAVEDSSAKKRPARKRPQSRPQPASAELAHSKFKTWLLLIPGLLSGLLLAFSRTLWSYSTITEVYSLNTFLIALIILLMVVWRRRVLDEQARADRFLNAAALTFGLALGVHHVTVGLTLFGLAAFVYSTEGIDFFIWKSPASAGARTRRRGRNVLSDYLPSRRLLRAALYSIAGLCVYLYLPLAALRTPLMDWGDPRTPGRFWAHVTGRQYQVFFSPSLDTMQQQFGEFMTLAGREFGSLWMPFALALIPFGAVVAFKRDRAAFWLIALIALINVPYALNYDIAEDKDAYYLPTFLAMSVAAGLGAAALMQAGRLRPLFSTLPVLGATLLLIIPAVTFASNLPYDNRSHYFIARDYADNIMASVEPGGMLLTIDWQVYSPLLYTSEIEKRRADAIVVDLNQLRRSWYYAYLNRAYPSLIAQTQDNVDAFLEDLRHWERDPDVYDHDLELNRRINTGFNQMILAFIRVQLQHAPVYLTQELVVRNDGQYGELTKALESAYQFVPQGLVFELSQTRDFRPPREPRLETRGLADGTLKFEKDDVVSVKVLPVYLSMLVNRGRYLAINGRHEQAIEAFRQALALDPGYSLAQRLLDQSALAIKTSQSGSH